MAKVPLDREPRRTANRQASQAADAAREAGPPSPRSTAPLSRRPLENANANNRPSPGSPTVPFPSDRLRPGVSAIPTASRRKNQAGLTARELEHFRDLLLAKRRELVGDMSSMEREALRSSGGSNLSTLPIHMADMGTDNYEQEFTLGLVEKDRNLLREINTPWPRSRTAPTASARAPASRSARPRLEAQPWARFSIEYARQMESRGQFRRMVYPAGLAADSILIGRFHRVAPRAPSYLRSETGVPP